MKSYLEGHHIARHVHGKKIISKIERLDNGELGIKTAYNHLTVDELKRSEIIQKEIDERDIKNK